MNSPWHANDQHSLVLGTQDTKHYSFPGLSLPSLLQGKSSYCACTWNKPAVVNSWKGLIVFCKAGDNIGLSSPLLLPRASQNAFRKATHVGDSPPLSTSAKLHFPASLGSSLGHHFLACMQTAPMVVTEGPKPYRESHSLPATTQQTPHVPFSSILSTRSKRSSSSQPTDAANGCDPAAAFA